MSNITIRAALESRLKEWAAAQSPKVPVSYQNVAFTKPSDFSPYLECFLLPNDTVDRELSATRQRYVGFFQINCWAQKGIGMRKAEQLAQDMVSLFPRILKLGALNIDATPSAGRALLDDSGWVIVPVLIKYRYET